MANSMARIVIVTINSISVKPDCFKGSTMLICKIAGRGLSLGDTRNSRVSVRYTVMLMAMFICIRRMDKMTGRKAMQVNKLSSVFQDFWQWPDMASAQRNLYGF